MLHDLLPMGLSLEMSMTSAASAMSAVSTTSEASTMSTASTTRPKISVLGQGAMSKKKICFFA